MKVLIFDASTLISLTINGLLPEFRELRKNFNGKFIITEDVRKEVIDKPLSVKRFKLEGVKIQQLLEDKIIELPDSLGVKSIDLDSETERFVEIANNTFSERGKFIHIVDKGEVSCVALASLLKKKKVESLLAIDERTMRTLLEDANNLKDYLGRKLHQKISSDKKNYASFIGFAVVRSSELMFLAYQKGLIRFSSSSTLEAILYGLKFNGCAITEEDIAFLVKKGKALRKVLPKTL